MSNPQPFEFLDFNNLPPQIFPDSVINSFTKVCVTTQIFVKTTLTKRRDDEFEEKVNGNFKREAGQGDVSLV